MIGLPGTGAARHASETGVAAIHQSGPVPAQPAAPENRALEQALADRAELIELCLYALDRARSAGVAERIEAGLARVGVTAIRPDGTAFDPGRHEAGGTVPAEDAALEGMVAETELAGFADRGRQVRAPIVTVYQRRGG